MINQQLLDYIKQQLQQGVSKEQIKSSLIANGWAEQDIEETFNFIENPVKQSSVSPSMQTISSLPGARAILGQAWAIYKQRLGTFLGIMVIPMLIMSVLIAVFADGEFLNVSLLSSKFAAGNTGLFVLLVILLFVVIFISQGWGQTALLYTIKDSQEKIGVIEAYRRGWHKIISYWWVSFLVGFITVGGLFLLIIPGIIFAVWFSLAVYILIAEDLKGMNALLKSREYVRGKWGSIFWRFFFIEAISSIISLIPVLIFWLLKIPFASEISEVIIGFFLTPLVMTYSFLVYSNLKALKGEVAFAPTGRKKATFIGIAIFGILFFLALIFFSFFLVHLARKERVRDAKRQDDIMQIRARLERYYYDYNKYPSSLNELSPEYLPSIPLDPLTNQPYQYQLEKDGNDYKVCAQLESTKTQKCLTSQ